MVIELNQMTAAEKLELIDTIWKSIEPKDLQPPAWHEAVVQERQRLLQSGEEQLLNWSDVREELRQRYKLA